MVTPEDRDHLLNGWPLGLQVMNRTRIRMAESSETLPAPFANLRIPSRSFSSLSSSELDTVSTASFFQDRSVSLGRLIGIRPPDKTWMYFPTDECERVPVKNSTTADEISGPICIPIVIDIVLKMIRNRRNSS